MKSFILVIAFSLLSACSATNYVWSKPEAKEGEFRSAKWYCWAISWGSGYGGSISYDNNAFESCMVRRGWKLVVKEKDVDIVDSLSVKLDDDDEVDPGAED